MTHFNVYTPVTTTHTKIQNIPVPRSPLPCWQQSPGPPLCLHPDPDGSALPAMESHAASCSRHTPGVSHVLLERVPEPRTSISLSLVPPVGPCE